ncbi:PREDICTED: receptor-like protein kinase [Nelumbo nucifera]|uniref:non-specific serine/threonine protein kinase n=1 Tax=Nelumbo nucifera TaxID=4432 RepID=A0A1U7Z637_NELNU|nr:PREDICTED: receptor-like protein kinase [Nelumbo nucifera]
MSRCSALSEALLSLLKDLTVPPSIISSWNSNDSTPCNWQGIQCDDPEQNVVTPNLSGMGISGSLRPEIGHLRSLKTIDLGMNNLSGLIPVELSNCTLLEYLDLSNLVISLNLSDHGLTGEIPSEIGKLNKIVSLDISHNNLSGSLEVLDALRSLMDVNVSYNLFTGPVPNTLIKLLKYSPSSFLGNPGICVPCLLGDGSNCTMNSNLYSLRSKPEVESSVGEGSTLSLNAVIEATDNLNDRFIIGRGAHRTVYKVILGPEKLYAVKKLAFSHHKGASESMIREIQTSGEIRHRNLVRLEDFWLRKDYGLILHKYMENGSLHDVLHVIIPPPVLKWEVRYRMALGISQG